jgi:hypothetical protein
MRRAVVAGVRAASAQGSAGAAKVPAETLIVCARRGPRRFFADLLWRAFPADSEQALAARAAPVLGVSERQVRNWLRQEHDAKLTQVLAVLAVAGVELVAARVERR